MEPEVIAEPVADSTSHAVDDIASQTAESASESNPAAMAALRESQLASAPVVRAVGDAATQSTGDATDSKGNRFDAAVHHANDDGTPKLYNGKLRRKRASKVGTVSTVNAGTPAAQSPAPVPQLTAEQIAKARLSGRVAADLFIKTCESVGGDDFAPIAETVEGFGKIDERADMQLAFADYFVATGKTDFPPGAMLCLVVSQYGMRRFAMPNTKTRVANLMTRVGARFALWRANRAKRKVPPVVAPTE